MGCVGPGVRALSPVAPSSVAWAPDPGDLPPPQEDKYLSPVLSGWQVTLLFPLSLLLLLHSRLRGLN